MVGPRLQRWMYLRLSLIRPPHRHLPSACSPSTLGGRGVTPTSCRAQAHTWASPEPAADIRCQAENLVASSDTPGCLLSLELGLLSRPSAGARRSTATWSWALPGCCPGRWDVFIDNSWWVVVCIKLFFKSLSMILLARCSTFHFVTER